MGTCQDRGPPLFHHNYLNHPRARPGLARDGKTTIHTVSIRQLDRFTASCTEVGKKRLAIRAYLSTRHQFEGAKWTGEVEDQATVATDIILLVNHLTAARTQFLTTLSAETVRQVD
jgi:hypothetical protein